MKKITKKDIDNAVDQSAKILAPDVTNIFMQNIKDNITAFDEENAPYAFYFAFLGTCLEVSRDMTRLTLYKLFLNE